MEILQVKEFNRRARAKYDTQLEEWKRGNIGVMPCLDLYIFTLTDGRERQRGYVATGANEGINKHVFGMNKLEAEKNYNK